MTTESARRERTLLWVVCIALAASYFFGIRSLPLRDYRETTYAEIGREMVEDGGWIVPHLNGTPHLDKPPLALWGEAASLKTFGMHEGAARIPSVLSILWTALVLGWMTRSVFGTGAGICAATLFLGCPGMQFYGRMLMTDTVFMACTITAMAAFVEGCIKESRAWRLAGFAACGVSVLARGPLGIIYPLGMLGLFILMTDRKAFWKIPWISGGILFAVIAAPWYLAIESKHPGFLKFFIVEHHLDRLASAAKHPFVAVPRWQIVLGFIGFMGPAAFALPLAKSGVRGERSTQFMFWIMAFLVMASVLVANGRNHPYTFPALPPLVGLAAAWFYNLHKHGESRGERLVALLTGLIGGVILGAMLSVGKVMDAISPLLNNPETRTVVSVCMGLVAVCIFMAAILIWTKRGLAACAAIAVMMFPGTFMLHHIQGHLAPLKSRAYLAETIARDTPEDWPFFLVNPKDVLFEGVGGWDFYGNRRVSMVAAAGPPAGPFQGMTRPEWIIDKSDFLDFAASGSPFVLAATPDAVALLPELALGSPIAKDGMFSVWVVNGPLNRN